MSALTAAAEENYSGLVREIRSCTSSEQFDLGGYNEVRARELIVNAFSKPLQAPTEMIKCTFVVGGGKLVRSKYAEDLGKWIVSALREIGFTEDHSAAETFDSQGTYKHQHDTGQNLKYLIVFPRVACASSKPDAAPAAQPGMDKSSPEYLLVASKLETFKDIVSEKAMSYFQKKAVQKILEENAAAYKAVEAKLVSGAMLTEAEQQLYDCSANCDDEKLAWLQAATKEMVDNKQLTAREQTSLLEHIQANLAALDAELQAARAENKPKKVEKLEAKRAAVLLRLQHVQQIQPIIPRLKHGDQIARHYQRLMPMYALEEEKGRSMSLTLQDLKALEDKPDLEQAIAALQAASRGWFCDEEDFQLMCRQEEKLARAQFKAQQQAAKPKPKAASASSSSWSTVGGGGGAKKSAGAGGKAAAKRPGSGFAAAFGDDSD